MRVFTEAELRYFQDVPLLARLATVGPDGTPHVTPVGMWSIETGSGIVEIRGHNFANTKKFRDVTRSGRAAIVIDDLASTDPWHPRGVEVRGRAEAVAGADPRIRIHPTRIIGWGLDGDGVGVQNARNVE